MCSKMNTLSPGHLEWREVIQLCGAPAISASDGGILLTHIDTSMYTIYAITNQINGKHYVGFTVKSAARRWTEHRALARRGSQCGIHRAIQKYGAGSFSVSVLKRGADHHWGHSIEEPKFISDLVPEYNMTKGGGGTLGKTPWNKGLKTGPLSLSTRLALSIASTKAQLGKKRGPYAKRKAGHDGNKYCAILNPIHTGQKNP